MAKNTTKEAGYTPTVWADGDTITADKLNKLEGGVANAQMGQVTQEDFDALVARVAALESAK